MSRRRLLALVLLPVPLAVLLLLLGLPELDATWENHPAHFWLVLLAGLSSLAVGLAVSRAAGRRRDARLFLISLAFVSSAGFLALHALATPGVLLGPNTGFNIATPVGLLVAGAFAAASAVEFRLAASLAIVRRRRWLLGGVLALLALWAVASLAHFGPLDAARSEEELTGPLRLLAAAALPLYGLAALGYLRLYRRRRGFVVFGATMAFALLAEAMLVVAFARNWQVSWWEWHVLMLLGFAFVGWSAWREWHEERFRDLYLADVLEGTREASLLFADLAGFTPFSERTPPAEVAAMLNAYWERTVPALEACGGDVHQLIGDALMVVFNKEGDDPEHALNAARAGLALQREAGRIAEEHPEWPRFRVGVNTGEVSAGVLGAGEKRQHGVVGDAVNVAARLEARAPVGGVLIGAETRRLLGARAVVEPARELDLKGKEEAVEAYVLHALGPAGEEEG